MRSVLVTALLIATAASAELLPVAPASSSRAALHADLLVALGHRDTAAMEAMIWPEADATVEIAQLLERYGGVRSARIYVTAEWGDEEGHTVVATVTATGDDGLTYEFTVPMGSANERYYLEERGHAPPTGREGEPRDPSTVGSGTLAFARCLM